MTQENLFINKKITATFEEKTNGFCFMAKKRHGNNYDNAKGATRYIYTTNPLSILFIPLYPIFFTIMYLTNIVMRIIVKIIGKYIPHYYKTNCVLKCSLEGNVLKVKNGLEDFLFTRYLAIMLISLDREASNFTRTDERKYDIDSIAELIYIKTKSIRALHTTYSNGSKGVIFSVFANNLIVEKAIEIIIDRVQKRNTNVELKTVT